MTDLERRAAVATVAAQFADLIKVLPNPNAAVPGSTWSCADVAAHVAIVVGSYQPYLRGQAEPILDYRDLPGSNARTLNAYRIRDPAVLASDITRATHAFLEASANRDGAECMPWHGTTLPIRAVYGIYLAELLLHGRDIAAVGHQPWPISQSHAAIALDGAIEVGPHFVDHTRAANLTATFRLRLRGADCYDFRFRGGHLTIERKPSRATHPECQISATPLAILLLTYRRTTPWRQLATGRLIATGRRPWLGLRFPSLFTRF